MNRAADQLSILDDFFFPITVLQLAVFLFYSFDFDYIIFIIAQEFRIRQILQPAETPPFLQDLIASPLRSELVQEDYWRYMVDRKRF